MDHRVVADQREALPSQVRVGSVQRWLLREGDPQPTVISVPRNVSCANRRAAPTCQRAGPAVALGCASVPIPHLLSTAPRVRVSPTPWSDRTGSSRWSSRRRSGGPGRRGSRPCARAAGALLPARAHPRICSSTVSSVLTRVILLGGVADDCIACSPWAPTPSSAGRSVTLPKAACRRPAG